MCNNGKHIANLNSGTCVKMQQLELITIENPCINVCQSDKRGYCLGCFRSRNERFNWAKMTAQEKRKVLELCKNRNKRRKAKQKKAEQASQSATQPVANEIAEQPKAAATKDDTSNVAKTNQSVQDMGLDLFDL